MKFKAPFGLLLLTMSVVGSGQTPPNTASPATAAIAAPTTRPSSGDVGADCVASFYHVLLQQDPPTLDQEKSLFARSWMRAPLVLTWKEFSSLDIEPATRTPEQTAYLHQLEAKVDAAGPVVLDYLRHHTERFIPAGVRPSQVQISSMWHVTRTVEKIVPEHAPVDPSSGNITVQFVDQLKDGTPQLHVVIFPIQDGKIDPSRIIFGGSGGKALGDILLQERNEVAKHAQDL